jgi:penicillin-binding protein 1A
VIRSTLLRRLPLLSTRPRRLDRGVFVLSLVLLALAVVALLAMLAAAIWVAWTWSQLPPLDRVREYRPRQHLQVVTREGIEIAQFGAERRLFVPYEQVPQRLKDAVLAIEDTGFYEHGGVSLRGVARAALANLTGGTPQGASTLTQQVARTFYLSTRRTAERKLKELLLALQIESELSKDQIFELYLNQIFLGQRAYGFGAAAMTYFGKPLDTLSIAETAMLAGLPQNPIHANPVANFDRARKRQLLVLERMAETGKISATEKQAAIAEALVLRNLRTSNLEADHVAEMARAAVVERFGEEAAYSQGIRVETTVRAADQRAAYQALRRAVLAHERKQKWRGPEATVELPPEPRPGDAVGQARLATAVAAAFRDRRDDEDLRLALVLSASPQEVRVQRPDGSVLRVAGEGLRLVQSALQANAPAALALRRGSLLRVIKRRVVPRDGGAAFDGWSVAQWPGANGAFVALDPGTGHIRALVGGFDFGRGQFNRATQAWRQPGSAFKPFVYSAAFERGLMPETLVDDAPLLNPDGSTPSWNPGNSDGKFDGEITVREAMVRSKNLVSIRVLQDLGVWRALGWVERFGFDRRKHPADLTLALGAGGTTPLQMAAAYAVFANGGHRTAPMLIQRIVDGEGKVLFEAPPPPPLDGSTRVISPRNVFLVSSLLADVTSRGTAARARGNLPRGDLYGKTGTTNDAVDAWFAGWATGAVAVAWIGYDTPKSLGERETGGGLALPMWVDAMTVMTQGVPARTLAPPGDVVQVAGGDWRYVEWSEGGGKARIGTPVDLAGAPGAPDPAATAASAAVHGPEPAASAPR